ncbi:MAG: CRISPR-associated protein Cas2 [Oceanospirillales bacterium]|nr:MAG: CRISPR-associated protein Cas2 [Oceanospirillales bacterium]
MKNLVITYDLKKSGQNYEGVIEAIKSFGGWARVQGSVWYVKTTLSASAVRDSLLRHIDSNDSLFVTDATNNDAAWYGLTDEVSDYLKQQWNK